MIQMNTTTQVAQVQQQHADPNLTSLGIPPTKPKPARKPRDLNAPPKQRKQKDPNVSEPYAKCSLFYFFRHLRRNANRAIQTNHRQKRRRTSRYKE